MTIPQMNLPVEIEPQASKIRVFTTNETHQLNKTPSLSQFGSSSPQRRCKCPQVLIADDDSFQHFYYHTLFQKSIGSKDLSDMEDLRLQLCYSGEELLRCLGEVQKCGCNTVMLVIIDYYMGKENLNGIETSIAVRKIGYEGFVLLRTSETQESLKEIHENIDELFSQKTISAFVIKSDLRKGKEIIQKVLNT